MGVSGKWFKALVGLKKSEKSQSLDKDENVGFLFFTFFFFIISSLNLIYAFFFSFNPHRGRVQASFGIGGSIRLSLMVINLKRSLIIMTM